MKNKLIAGVAILVLSLAAGTVLASDHHDTSRSLVAIDGQLVGYADGDVAKSSAPMEYAEGQKLKFTVQTKNFPSGAVFSWNFGDDSPEVEGPTAEHTYKQAGNYDAVLLTKSGGNWVKSTTIDVPVGQRVVDMTKVLIFVMLGVCLVVVVIMVVYLRRQRQDSLPPVPPAQ